MTYQELFQSLRQVYDEREAKAVAGYVLDVRFHLTLTDIACGGLERLPASSQAELQAIAQRLLTGEPVQYVLGVADFGPRQFQVSPHVLIPRPETYELCQWILQESLRLKELRTEPLNILDIGTGSGCIACTLAAELPEAQVTAWDVDEEALCVARENARQLGVSVDFEQQDMLQIHAGEVLGTITYPKNRWDIIVSNPPYIAESERASMERNVLDYEPEEALFVPDDDPLLFYRAIAHYAHQALKPFGELYFEINPRFAQRMLQDEDFIFRGDWGGISLREDQFGRQRFLKTDISWRKQPNGAYYPLPKYS